MRRALELLRGGIAGARGLRGGAGADRCLAAGGRARGVPGVQRRLGAEAGGDRQLGDAVDQGPCCQSVAAGGGLGGVEHLGRVAHGRDDHGDGAERALAGDEIGDADEALGGADGGASHLRRAGWSWGSGPWLAQGSCRVGQARRDRFAEGVGEVGRRSAGSSTPTEEDEVVADADGEPLLAGELVERHQGRCSMRLSTPPSDGPILARVQRSMKRLCGPRRRGRGSLTTPPKPRIGRGRPRVGVVGEDGVIHRSIAGDARGLGDALAAAVCAGDAQLGS